MTDIVTVNVGDTVIVAHMRNRNLNVREAEVLKVGRVWIDVTPEYGSNPDRFRMDTQTDGSQYGDPPRFYTLAQWAVKQRSDGALSFLREQGIDLRYDSPWRGREIELADILRNAT